MKSSSRFLLSCAVGAALLTGSRVFADTINPAVTYSSDTPLSDSRPFTLGYQFSLSDPMTVNALGYWVQGGYANGQQVGLWDNSGNLLTSATIEEGDPVVDGFEWAFISSLSLGDGTYTIGGTYNGGIFSSSANGVSTVPGFTWITDEQTYGSGLNDPTESTDGGYGQNGILQVDLSVNGGSPVPDSGSVLALLGGTFAALAAFRRRVLVRAA